MCKFEITGNIKAIRINLSGKGNDILRIIPDCEFRISKYAVLLPSEPTNSCVETVLVPFDNYLEIEVPVGIFQANPKHIALILEKEHSENTQGTEPQSAKVKQQKAQDNNTVKSVVVIRSDNNSIASNNYRLVEVWQS